MIRTWIALVVSCLGFSAFASAADWPNWRGPEYTGVSTEADWSVQWPTTGPRELWEAEVGIGFSSVTVAAGRAYTMGNRDDQDVVTCLDAQTGQILWTHRHAEPRKANLYQGGPNATPTIANGKVFTLSKEGKVFCFQADTGAVVWRRDIRTEYQVKKPMWGFTSSPLVLGDKVYLNAGAAGMALRIRDGALVWQNGSGPAGYASLVPYGQQADTPLIVFSGTEVAAVSSGTGEILWRQRWKTGWKVNAADPLVVAHGVFVASGHGKGCAYFKIGDQAVTEVYHSKALRSQCYGGALYRGYVYGFDGDVNKRSGALVCLEPQTGQVMWRQEKMGVGALKVAGDRLLILENRGRLTVARAQPGGFEALASARILEGTCWTVPTLANGLIYARNAAGHLVCLDVR